MSGYGLIKSFDIDRGELDNISRTECFVLGYELAQIDNILKHEHGEINQLVHSANRERVAKSCNDSGRPYRLTWMDEDPSEAWMMLHVAEKSART